MHNFKLIRTLLLTAGVVAIWSITPEARGDVTLTTLVSFDGTNGATPYAGLVQGKDGNFYGTTAAGGTNGYGTVFQMTPSGTLKTLVSFNSTNGAAPVAELAWSTNGDLYGATYSGGAAGFGTLFTVTTGGTFTALASFVGTNGIYPKGALVQGADGNFYGTTALGGTNSEGTVFRLDGQGTLTTLAAFDSAGADPYAGLVQGADGNFYGTTYQGGGGSGTVFTMTAGGALNPLYSFTGGTDGSNPYASLVQAADGTLYGTTFFGGTNGYGAVFSVATNGFFIPLASFNGTNGAHPQARLRQAPDGSFYGTTVDGGQDMTPADLRYGTIFKLTTNLVLSTVLSFGNTNGAHPQAGLVLAADGSFYGTTADGGASSNGTIFRLTFTAPPPPVFRTVAHTGTTLTLSWSTMAGQKYQLQYKTNVNGTTWSNLSSAVTATDITLTGTDVIGPGTKRYYRVVLLP